MIATVAMIEGKWQTRPRIISQELRTEEKSGPTARDQQTSRGKGERMRNPDEGESSTVVRAQDTVQAHRCATCTAYTPRGREANASRQ